MGFTLNQLEQERQIRKLQKKEDKDTKDYEQLSNLPKINNVELKGDKTTSDLGINANNVMMSDGVMSAEEALDEMTERFDGLKMYKKEISVTFNNSIYAGPFSISTETGEIVTANNIKSMAVAGVGVAMYPVFSSNKTQFYIYSNEVQNITALTEIIFFYT